MPSKVYTKCGCRSNDKTVQYSIYTYGKGIEVLDAAYRRWHNEKCWGARKKNLSRKAGRI